MHLTKKLFEKNIKFLFFVLCLLIVPAEAQWVNNPAENTQLVVDAYDPVNITTSGDGKGGAFVFWEDNRSPLQSDIYFIHVNGNGNVTFRADGKEVSENNSEKKNPVSAPGTANSSVVIWKDFYKNNRGYLFAQRVLSNGNLAWGKNGIRITKSQNEVTEYAVQSDLKGNALIAYIEKGEGVSSNFELKFQKVNQTGKILLDSTGISAEKSKNRISSPIIYPDNAGGAYMVWIENRNNKGILLAQRIDSTGKKIWGKNALEISVKNYNTILYSVHADNPNFIYMAWQVQKDNKQIFHQVINSQGKAVWQTGGLLVSSLKGDQINPQTLVSDSTLILSWTNHNEKDRDIYIQKFSLKGKPIWNSEGTSVIGTSGDQFGQKLISDGKGGAIVVWIDRREPGKRANIYAQRVTMHGKLAWGSDAIKAASFPNSEKSYLSIVSDDRGSAIIIFKDNREENNGIFSQKVFNTGTYVSQIIGFKTEFKNDSVNISWYSANELGKTTYDIERTAQFDNAENPWEIIKSFNSDGKPANYFEYADRPENGGTYYYRVIQKDDAGNIQISDVTRVNLLETAGSISVAQNIPNPFSDETIIKFYLPSSEKVSVEFYNSRVEKISSLESKEYPEGEHEIKFSADGLQSGVYFYRIKIGDFTEVKKMVIAN